MPTTGVEVRIVWGIRLLEQYAKGFLTGFLGGFGEVLTQCTGVTEAVTCKRALPLLQQACDRKTYYYEGRANRCLPDCRKRKGEITVQKAYSP